MDILQYRTGPEAPWVGIPALKGDPGISVKSISINNNNHIVITLDDDSTIVSTNAIPIQGNGINILIVEELPTTGVEKTIYMVLRTEAYLNDYYDEYMWINNKWEIIGSTRLDLSNYYTKSEVNDAITNAVTAVSSNYTAGAGIEISDDNQIINITPDILAYLISSAYSQELTPISRIQELPQAVNLTQALEQLEKYGICNSLNYFTTGTLYDGGYASCYAYGDFNTSTGEFSTGNNYNAAENGSTSIPVTTAVVQFLNDGTKQLVGWKNKDQASYWVGRQLLKRIQYKTNFTNIQPTTSNLQAILTAIDTVLGGIPSIATTETAGIVKPDGTSITVDSNGVISANATAADIGYDNTNSHMQATDIQSAIDYLATNSGSGGSDLPTDPAADGSYKLINTVGTNGGLSWEVDTAVPTKTSDLTNDSGFITSVPLATANAVGAVKPDGTSITIDSNGTISAQGGGSSLPSDPVVDGSYKLVNTVTTVEGTQTATQSWEEDSGSGGASYTFTNGLTESNGTVSWDLNNDFRKKTNNSTNSDCYILSDTTSDNYINPKYSNNSLFVGTTVGLSGIDYLDFAGSSAIMAGLYRNGARCIANTGAFLTGDIKGSVTAQNGAIATVNSTTGSESVVIGPYSIAAVASGASVSNQYPANLIVVYGGSNSVGQGSGIIGKNLNLSGSYQLATGQYNIPDSGTYAHIVGNGNNSTQSNAYALDWNGNGHYSGGLYVHCTDYTTTTTAGGHQVYFGDLTATDTAPTIEGAINWVYA